MRSESPPDITRVLSRHNWPELATVAIQEVEQLRALAADPAGRRETRRIDPPGYVPDV